MSTAQLIVTTLLNLGNIFEITTGIIAKESQNTGFEMFGQNSETSNPG